MGRNSFYLCLFISCLIVFLGLSSYNQWQEFKESGKVLEIKGIVVDKYEKDRDHDCLNVAWIKFSDGSSWPVLIPDNLWGKFEKWKEYRFEIKEVK